MLIAGNETEGIGLGTAQFAACLAYSPFGGPAGPIPPAALALARRRGVSPQRVLVAWLRQQSPNIVPLAGASRPSTIRDSAAGLDLTDQDLKDLCAGPEVFQRVVDDVTRCVAAGRFDSPDPSLAVPWAGEICRGVPRRAAAPVAQSAGTNHVGLPRRPDRW